MSPVKETMINIIGRQPDDSSYGAVTGADLADAELQRAIARDRADKARCLAPGLKLVVGARLFDVVRSRMLAGIRNRHPDWPLAEIEMEFRRQLAMLRQREDRGVFTPVEPQ